MVYDGIGEREPMKPLLERYKVSVWYQAPGLDSMTANYAGVEEFYSPNPNVAFSDSMDSETLSRTLAGHRDSGKSLVFKIKNQGGKILTVPPHSLCSIEVTENKEEDSETNKD